MVGVKIEIRGRNVTTARLLYELQQVDLAIEAKQRDLNEVEAQLGESEELRAARARLESVQQRLAQIERTQREQELELQSLADKLKAEENRLYSGRVKNPKELAGLQKEVRYLTRRRDELEEQLLETMVAREELQTQVNQAMHRLQDLEAEWKDQQASLVDAQRRLQEELLRLHEQREALRKRLGQDALDTYNYLRRTKGIAVAPLEGGLCGGCRVALPTVDLQRAQGGALAHCSNCGRILVIL